MRQRPWCGCRTQDEMQTVGSSSDAKLAPSGKGSEKNINSSVFSFHQEDTEGAQSAALGKLDAT